MSQLSAVHCSAACLAGACRKISQWRNFNRQKNSKLISKFVQQKYRHFYRHKPKSDDLQIILANMNEQLNVQILQGIVANRFEVRW